LIGARVYKTVEAAVVAVGSSVADAAVDVVIRDVEFKYRL
jgi:hypothetical protein